MKPYKDAGGIEMNISRGMIAEDTFRYMGATLFGTSNSLARHVFLMCRRHRRFYPY